VTDLIQVIRESWGWIGLDPVEVIRDNDFGNLIVRDSANYFWRICPEEASCEVVAKNQPDLDALFASPDFIEDWEMIPLVETARGKLGPLEDGRKYYLVLPGVIGGRYDASNMQTLSLLELIGMRGDFAREIKDLPDGTKVRIDVGK
jgi:hypothetical protein